MTKLPEKRKDRKLPKKETGSTPQAQVSDQNLQDVIAQLLAEPEANINGTQSSTSEDSPVDKPARSKMWDKKWNLEALKPRKKKQKSVEDRWSKSHPKRAAESENKILFAIVLVFGVLILFSLGILFKTLLGESNSTSEIKNIELVDGSDDTNRAMPVLVNEARSILSSYIESNTIEEKSKYIYKFREFRPLIEAYYDAKVEPEKIDNPEIISVVPITISKKAYWKALVSYATSPSDIYYLRTNDSGELKVDWKSSVVYQDNDVQKFIESQSIKPTLFRVYLDLSGERPVYNWGYTEDEYYSLVIEIPSFDGVLWGYIKKDSETSNAIQNAIKDRSNHLILANEQPNEFTVMLKFKNDSPTSNTQHILIDKIISNSWLNTEE